jgi:tape measure domain-containing protein
MNPIQTRFETIGGSPEKGEELLTFAETIAQDLNTPLLASIEGFSRLTAASKGSKLEGKDTEELFIGVSQAMAALGLNAQDASLIFLAFQQVISKGKVAAEELRGQIGERLPGAIQLAAKSMGMSVVDFGKQLDLGQINANILLPKFAEALQEEYGAGAEAASKSFLGTLNKIENSLFNFRRLFANEFGGIVAGIARVAATALDLIIKFIDNVLLKSGLMFNAILGIQAQIIAGTAFIFSKLDIPLALAKALSGGYGKMYLVLFPFVFGLFQEIIGTVLAKVFGIEIAGAVEMISGFFSQVVGRVIQTVIDVGKDPKQIFEGLVNLARSVGIGVVTASTAFVNLAASIREQFGLATETMGFFITKLAQAEKLINKIADSTIGRIYAPQVESADGVKAPEQQRGGMLGDLSSAFNGKAIARASLEFFGLFVIMIQTMVLLRIMGEQVLKMGGAFKVFGAEFAKALMSLKTGKSILSMLTLGFTGFNLVLAGLVTLLALMVFKSDSVNTFLSELSNSVKDLETLNANLDTLTNRKINITTRITQLDDEGLRETPFQDKGLTLSFWRAREQEQITTDDIIRRIQKRIDDNAYRRDLPLLPENFNENQGSMVDADNIQSLGNNLSSFTGRVNPPESFTELVEFRQKLIKERAGIEEDLTMRLKLDSTNIYDELNRLQIELGKVDSSLGEIDVKQANLDSPANFNPFDLQKSKTPAVDLVKIMRAIVSPLAGSGMSGQAPVVLTNALLGAEKIDLTEQEILLNQQKKVLEAQIAAYERQADLAPGGTLIIEENSLESYASQLRESLDQVNDELELAQQNQGLSPIALPSLIETRQPGEISLTGGVEAAQNFERLTEVDLLQRQQQSLTDTLALLDKAFNVSTEQLDREIKQRKDLINRLQNPSNNVGRTGQEQNQREITTLQKEVVGIEAQKQAVQAAPGRDELKRINQDLRALDIFAKMPGVFNNAFTQDDTAIREIVIQQLDVFSTVQDDRINVQRLDEGNLVSLLPQIIDDVATKQKDFSIQRQSLIDEIAQLDLTSEGAQTKLARFNEELKDLDKQLLGLKGLDIFLGVAQSYADLGAGKQSLDQGKITRSLSALAQDLATSPIQSEASQQFQQTPTLPNLAQVEQSILIDLVPAREAVTRAQSERQNILDSPVLRSENDLRRAGFVSKEKKGELDLLEAREKRLSDAIAQTRSAVTDAYGVYNEAAIDGLDFQPALDGYYAVQEELKVLTGQLQDLRNERDKVLDEVKELAPPIQVDDTARQQRLDSVDRAITDAEGRVNELLKQFQLIQETKSGLGGLGQLGEGLELTADKLREEPKGFFGKLREGLANDLVMLNLPSNEKRAVEFESRAQSLTPALGTVSSFVAQQQDLSPIAKKALAGGINSGNFSLTKQTLESIEIKDGKVYFGGEELDGTNKEINAFVDALKTATKILNLVGGDSNKGSKPVQEALAEGLGIETKNTEREAISNRYLQQIAALSTKGVFSESQLNELTKGGVKLADADKIIGDVRNQDGSTNFQAVIERLQAQGLSEGDIRDVINDLGKLEQVFVDALALDPKGSTKVRLGTIGEEEYTQTVGKLDQISGLARESSMKLGLQYYNGDLAEFETAIKDVKPEFLANIEQLRNLESELEVLGNQRLLLAEQLKRTDLTKEERSQIEKDSERLDDSFKAKYREKQVAGEELSAANDLVKGVDKALTALEEKIEDSGLANSIKKTLLGQIKTVRDEDITPALDFFSKQEELMVASGEEAVEAANKAITKAMENFEKTVLIIDSTASKKLSDITTALREFSNNTAFAVTDLSKAVAGLPGDPVRLRAEKELAVTSVSETQAKEKLDAAQLAKDDTDKELNRIEREAAFFSPNAALQAVEAGKAAQREAQNILSEANNEYSAALAAKTEAQLALLDVEASAPVRISQINSRGISNARKQQQANGGITREEADRLQLNDEIGLIDIELASTEIQLATISKQLQEGLIKDVGVANGKIEELVNTQQDLISARLDKILEKENQQREKSIKLLENQTNLSAKYFDVAINGYEALNKASEQFSKQLDNLTKVGEELKNLAGIEFQSKIGLSENKTNLIDTSRGIADNLASGDLSPQQQSFQQRRLAGIQQLGNQAYGISPSAFGSNEDAALVEQQKIATQMAKDKMEALEKEQAIAAKLLAIEIKRNEIAAQMAVKEAEIGQLRAEQAAIQAQLALRQATIETANSEDKTPVLLAELELAIANSQLGLAGEEVDVAKQSQALQDLFANLQKQSADATSESSRDDLITEIAGNENVDVSQLITALNNFKDFDPNSVNPREVFAPYLDWIESQTPQRNPNTPIGLPLEQFNGDIQAWIDGNIAIAKQEQANLKPPAEIKALDDLFNQVFGEAVGDKISMSNRPGGDIGQELEIIAAARLGEKVAPTQAMIESVSGQREIENALDQGRRLAQETDPIDGTRMASDIYSMSTDMADMISEILVVQKLLGKIASESTLGTNQATPAATESVKDLMEKIDIASGFRDVLAPIVGDEKSSAITAVSPEEFESLMNQTKDLPPIPTLQPLPSNSSLKLDPSEFLNPPSFSEDFELPSANPLTRELDGILDTTLPDVPSLPSEFDSSSTGAVKEYADGSTIIGRSKYVPSTAGGGSLEQKTGDIASGNSWMNNPLNNLTNPVTQVASNIFNPTIQNRVNPNYTPPSINVAAQQRDPDYFYRNLASEVKPRIDYRVPSGVQQANEEVASNPARSAPTTINITNKIDANSQREIYQKIGDIQAQAIISALGNLA